MGSKSAWFEKRVLDAAFGNQPFPQLATLYFALYSTGTLTDASTGADPGALEVSGDGYARAAVANNLTNFPVATGAAPSSKSNATTITFPTATGDGWGTVTQWAVLDSATAGGGNILYLGTFRVAKQVLEGDTATFPPGLLTVTEQ